MIDQITFLKRIVQALEQTHIPYMIAGSIGSSFHGHPRATNDTDLVIDPTQQQLINFLELWDAHFYISRQAAIEAVNSHTMFNIIDTQSGYKADLIIRKQRPFSQQEFSRRLRTNLMGIEMYVLSPEDSILSKLEWTQGRVSQTQFKDALGVLTIQRDRLDFEYLRHWARELGVQEALRELMTAAGL